MNCKNLNELLSVYAEGELTGIQRDFIEDHLSGCPVCQATLIDYKRIQEQLFSLQQTPAMPDMKERVMTKIKLREVSTRFRQWLRPALLTVTVVVIVVFILALQPFGISEDTLVVISKAYVATEALTSFKAIKIEYSQTSQAIGLFSLAHGEIKYISPNRYQLASEVRMTAVLDSTLNMEIIRIDDVVYINQLWFPFEFDEQWFDNQVPTIEKTLEYLDLLVEVKKLADEEIDDTDCYHYMGVIDMEKYIERLRPKWKKLYTEWIENMENYPGDIDDYIENLESRYRNLELTCELWIGKEDYLIRKSKYISQQLPDEITDSLPLKSISECTYFDFNEDFVIEAPLDESGELLSGWTCYSLEE